MTSLLCSSIIYGAKNGFLPIPNPVVSLSEKPCSSSENKKRCFCLSERTQLTAHTQCGFWTCLYFYIMLAKYCKFSCSMLVFLCWSVDPIQHSIVFVYDKLPYMVIFQFFCTKKALSMLYFFQNTIVNLKVLPEVKNII